MTTLTYAGGQDVIPRGQLASATRSRNAEHVAPPSYSVASHATQLAPRHRASSAWNENLRSTDFRAHVFV